MKETLCVVGLGYVGLPLTVVMAGEYQTVGYDCDSARINELLEGRDTTGEVSQEQLSVAGLRFTATINDAADCAVYIITVPTPVKEDKRPDLSPLRAACRAVGGVLAAGDLVIIESTVYPGVTEEVCVPLIAAVSGLEVNKGFFCGYSPERVNPADRARSIKDIKKITAGSSPESAARTDAIYKAVISAGTHQAPSIRVAEAAKVMENTQRDVNIALMNELAMVCHSLKIDATAVFAAAASKWNFLNFVPGLVGGHCIGVDPYYLCHKAQISGYQPNLVLAARQINDGMGRYVAENVLRLMAQRGLRLKHAEVLILGFTFKEECPDPRNSRVEDIRRILHEAGCGVRVCDPIADKNKTLSEYGFVPEDNWQAALEKKPAVVIFAVAHRCFANVAADTLQDALVIDIKGAAPRADWRL